MPELDDLIRRLAGPEPRAAAAPRPWPFPARQASVLALAAAILVSVGSWVAWESPRTTRGVDMDPVSLDLRLVVERGGEAYRVSRGSTYFIGERVFFRVAASREQEVTLWVLGPRGREPIAEVLAGPGPQDLGSARGLVGYAFDNPGRHTFVLVQGDLADCTPERCPSVAVEVR